MPRSAPPADPARGRVAGWMIDAPRCRLFDPADERRELRLEPKVMQLLEVLVHHRGEVVAKEQLLSEVWADSFVGDQVLTNAIWELRRVLGDDSRRQRWIQTVPRRGYRLAEEDGPTEEPAIVATPSWRSRQWRWWAVLGLAAAVLALALVRPWRPAATVAPPQVARFAVQLADPLAGLYLPVASWVPDGSTLVFASQSGDSTLLARRAIDELEVTPIAGTEGARQPFVSPDGREVGFVSGGSLRRVSLAGGAPIELHPVGAPRGAAWGDDGWIYFTPDSGTEIWRLPAAGGAAERVTQFVGSEWTHRWPEVVPGASAILFVAADDEMSTGFDQGTIWIQSLSTGERRKLFEGGTWPRVVGDTLLLVRGADLLAAPFDHRRQELTAPPRRVLEGVRRFPINGAAQIAVSRGGSLAYVPAGEASEPERRLVRVDSDGGRELVGPQGRQILDPALSPDGRSVAMIITEEGNSDIWLYDLQRQALQRLTDTPGEERGPVWTPDGREIAYSYALHGPFQIFRLPIDGSSVATSVQPAAHGRRPECFTPDGTVLVFSEIRPESRSDLLQVSVDGSTPPSPLLATRFDERQGRVSPDGRWLAYTSDESGRRQVYLRGLNGPEGKRLISTEGGEDPVWAADSRRLVFRSAGSVREVAVDHASGGAAGVERILLEWRFPRRIREWEAQRQLDRFPDGALLLLEEGAPQPQQIEVVLGWGSEVGIGQ